MPDGHSVVLRPITTVDVPYVAEFLHDHLNARLSAAQWAAAIVPPWPGDHPNHGFQLLDGATVVGAYVAFYSEREVDGRAERFCNLAAWCVREDYREHSLRLLRALMRQRGHQFTDLSPTGNVVAVNTRLGFTRLDTTTALVCNVPRPSLGPRVRVTSDPRRVRQLLHGQDLEVYRDHAGAVAAHHVVVTDRGRTCYVIFRRDRRKRLPIFASILHVSDRELFARTRGHVFGHLLLRHGIPVTLAELRVVGERPPLSLLLPRAGMKMYRGSLRPDQIDYLYSELTCVAW